ncbi:Glycosyltransferase [Heracleum sosnowskyi]|uniref:Glycosyltransferase n=1 Tax=Heracleum sosnowskyi TaxID=360622 RepID=A0AAD8N5A2_9APIA|nr:Glycosyltransferase [Heracleum sosnowskyi]
MGYNEAEKQATESEVTVVIVPFPAQGHLNQLLHLSRLVSSYNIQVHYVTSAIHCRQAKLRVQGWDSLSTPLIKFHEFPVPAFDSPPANPHSPFQFPSHLVPSFYSALHLRKQVAELLSALSATAKRVVVIYDYLIPYIGQDVASLPNGEAYSFHPLSAFRVFCETVGESGFEIIDDLVVKQLPSIATTLSSEVMEFFYKQGEDLVKYSSGALYNTCKAIEAPFLDVLANVNDKQWAIGPFNPVEICKAKYPSYVRHKCLDWLDKQVCDSVIFVSFGTTTSLTDEQVESLAIGLENSGQKFIWVLRDADKADIFLEDVRAYKLPNEYEERLELNGQGIIVRDWAPQLEMLAHASIGGFMSHCGWNSCLESITMGVPIATWPMHSDQPHNALLVTKVLKIGVVVKDWARRDELVESSTIEKAVRQLMVSQEGEEIRKRTVELGMTVKRSVAQGGDTRAEIDDFIAHIRR